MSIAPHLKIIGRGRDGARSLSTEDAHDLFEQVLERRVTDLEIGAFVLAMRIKGETTDELRGFLQAAHERCVSFVDGVPDVLLPSYNGARRLPNLTPLLAWRLARQGLRVLVHGVTNDATRVTTSQLIEALDWPVCRTSAQVYAAWRAQRPAFMPIDALCPRLSSLLDVRWTVGLRNPGHTVAKLLDPSHGRALRVVNHTHPEYASALSTFLIETKAAAMLMRGTEGEPVADARRLCRFDIYLDGQRVDALSAGLEEGALPEPPPPLPALDVPTTVAYIREIMLGVKEIPKPIDAQCTAICSALAARRSPV